MSEEVLVFELYFIQSAAVAPDNNPLWTAYSKLWRGADTPVMLFCSVGCIEGAACTIHGAGAVLASCSTWMEPFAKLP